MIGAQQRNLLCAIKKRLTGGQACDILVSASGPVRALSKCVVRRRRHKRRMGIMAWRACRCIVHCQEGCCDQPYFVM